MTKNMGGIDRALRLLAAAIIAVLYLSGQITGTIAVILGVVAVLFTATAALGFCPLYVPFGLSTRKDARLGIPKM